MNAYVHERRVGRGKKTASPLVLTRRKGKKKKRGTPAGAIRADVRFYPPYILHPAPPARRAKGGKKKRKGEREKGA